MKVRKTVRASVTFVALLEGSACTSNVVGSTPPVPQQVVPAQGAVLQLAVGTATVGYAQGNCADSGRRSAPFIGLNFVETFRQKNGRSAVLYDTPTLTGPPGFRGDANIEPVPGTKQYGITPSATIYNSFAGASTPYIGLAGNLGVFNNQHELGAFGYGLSGESLLASPVYELSGMPGFDLFQVTCNFALNGPRFIGGPPAWPAVNSGFYPTYAGFAGYSMGFYEYLSTPLTNPPLGTYRLDVAIPTAQNPAGRHVSAEAALKRFAPLPAFPVPSARPDPVHPGGLIITATVPAGVMQAFAEIRTSNGGSFTVALPVTTPGVPIDVVLPANLGVPAPGSLSPSATIPSDGGTYYNVYCVGFDYDAFGASYPGNTQQTPAIAGPNGQADVTTSDVFSSSGFPVP